MARWGARISLLISGGGLIGGTILLLAPGGDVVRAVVALALLGLAVAGVIPTALSVAARRSSGNNATVASGLMASAYLCLMICPPLVGWLSELFSLRAAWLIVGLSGLGIVALARSLREARR
jgi:fucose permease